MGGLSSIKMCESEFAFKEVKIYQPGMVIKCKLEFCIQSNKSILLPNTYWFFVSNTSFQNHEQRMNSVQASKVHWLQHLKILKFDN